VIWDSFVNPFLYKSRHKWTATWLTQEKHHHYRFKWATTFFRYSFSSLIHSLSRECAYTLFPLPQKSFFRALPSICFLSFSFFFYLEMEPNERTPLCKTIVNPFWRPFSLSFFKSFVSHPASRPRRFHFDFTTSSLPNSFTLIVSSSLDSLL